MSTGASHDASAGHDGAYTRGASPPCSIAGIDLGGLLYTLLMMGWLVILLLTFMLLTLVIWLGIGLRALASTWLS